MNNNIKTIQAQYAENMKAAEMKYRSDRKMLLVGAALLVLTLICGLI